MATLTLPGLKLFSLWNEDLNQKLQTFAATEVSKKGSCTVAKLKGRRNKIYQALEEIKQLVVTPG